MSTIDPNTKLRLIPQVDFKNKIADMLIKMNKDLGNKHTNEEIAYIASEIWKPIYFRNDSINIGLFYKFYDDFRTGKTQITKLTVQSVMSNLSVLIEKFKEMERVNNEKMMRMREEKIIANGTAATNSSISRAACWMITARCDGYDVDHLTTRQVAEYIEKGKNPNELLK